MKKVLAMIIAVLMISGLVQSQDLSLKSIKPMLGVTFPESPWGTGFVIGADVDMGELTENLHLVPGIAYWSSSYTEDLGFLGTYDLTLSDFRIGADVHYYFPQVKGLYGGGGLSLNFFGSDGDGTKVGVDFLAGYKMPLKSITLFGQGKYNIVSDFGSFELVVGAEFPLGGNSKPTVEPAAETE